MSDQGGCPRCGGVFETGYVVDHTYGAFMQSRWFRGVPARSFWAGLKLKGIPSSPVTTYRCTACGYLESYAPDEPAVGGSPRARKYPQPGG